LYGSLDQAKCHIQDTGIGCGILMVCTKEVLENHGDEQETIKMYLRNNFFENE
jgi:hypothetical protein